jgi:hypothetical protein
MNYSNPYRLPYPKQFLKYKKRWVWEFKRALEIGGIFVTVGICQLLLILMIDLPRHDYRVPFVRMALALLLFIFSALCGIDRKVIKEYYSE